MMVCTFGFSFLLYLILMIKFVSWNVRGAGSDEARIALKDLCKREKLDVLIVLEPRISGDTAKNVISDLGFTNFEVSDADGFSGGIWVLWNNFNIGLDVVHTWEQSITVRINYPHGKHWMMSAVYGKPSYRKRLQFWDSLSDIARSNTLPWLLLGDFNDILLSSEQSGRWPGRSKGFK
jgi:exonuclease III